MRTAFWASAIVIAYVYIGYPLLLAAWSRMKGEGAAPHRGGRGAALQTRLPRISIIIAARNEARRLPGRIDNLMALDYPGDRRQIVVVSDGSTDDTAASLSPYGDAVRLVGIPASGKAVALNEGIRRADGDVLVFTDARQRFAPDAVRALVAPFVDPHVGGVSGELILGAESNAGRRSGTERRSTPLRPQSAEAALRLGVSAGVVPGGGVATVVDERRTIDRRARSSVGDSVGIYWRYEKRLRQMETEVGSMLGATGAIYALRRSLWRPLPPGTILDDVLAPMRAVLAGWRVVFEPRAQAFDATARDADTESRRKIRTLAGNFQLLWFEPRLLVPFVNPVWLQFTSHKVGRLLVPYALMALFASSLALAGSSLFYGSALAAQCAFYLHGGYGAWLEHRDQARVPRRSVLQRSSRMAFTIVVMNVSAVAGAGYALLGRKVWR
jgi:cellulose synthase/poly-beta-1,6-N-acetylglucosamine synthase-like glycosyltransferase